MNNILNYHLFEMIKTANKYLCMRTLELGHCVLNWKELANQGYVQLPLCFHKATQEDKTTPILQSFIRCRINIYTRDSVYMFVCKYTYICSSNTFLCF